MRRSDITYVLCLSCVLIVIYVKSQPSCSAGWFGSRCNYKCRCVNDQCDKNGRCINPSTCLLGWFGPECQYTDMTDKSTNSVLTDGNENTCADPSGPDTVTISFESIFFTWLRVCVKVWAANADMTVTFSRSTTKVNCSDLKQVDVDTKTVDVHCNFAEEIDTVTLKGAAVTSLCSVYVSGGRNVGLKEMAKQDSTYENKYPAELAVDGDRRHLLYEKTCSATNGTTTWTLTLSQTRMVKRYDIYNRGDYILYWMRGFILESFDSNTRSVFRYQETYPHDRFCYRVNHMPKPIKIITLATVHSDKILAICEFEAHGDSLCDNEHYGRDCELSCQCPDKLPCVASTGLCPIGCPPGYVGLRCLTECSPGQFGKGCSQTCSSNCKKPDNSAITSCNHVTGSCLHGCKIGLTGAFCENECVGTFGQDCNQTCSLTCEQPDNSSKSSCNHITGDCLMGCKPGYSGALCETECVGTFGQDCKQTCSLTCEQPDNSSMPSCNHITGDCLMTCKPGYSGTFCETECVADTFGKDCKSECSKNCQPSGNANDSMCDPMTGICFKGCKDGSQGELCESVCAAGTFGNNCKSECSKNCQPFGNANDSMCDPVTGACLKGCKEGSHGELCESVASVATTSSGGWNIEMIIGLCTLFAATFFVGFCLRKKKRRHSSEEATAEADGRL